MKIPKSGRDINKKWVEHILSEHKAATDPHSPPGFLQVDSCTVREGKEEKKRLVK